MYNFKEKALIVSELEQSRFAELDLELLIEAKPESRQAFGRGVAASRHEAILHELLDVKTKEAVLEYRAKHSEEAEESQESEESEKSEDSDSSDVSELKSQVDELEDATAEIKDQVDKLAEDLDEEKKSDPKPAPAKKAKKKSTP